MTRVTIPYLEFDNGQTVSGVTIDLGNSTGYYAFLYENDTTGAGNEVLKTLATNVTIDVVGNAQIEDSGFSR